MDISLVLINDLLVTNSWTELRIKSGNGVRNVLIDHQVRSWRLKVGDDLKILVTIKGCWWQLLNVGAALRCVKIVNIGYQNGQNRQQHLKIVINAFRLQHLSPTSILKFWHDLEIFIWPPVSKIKSLGNLDNKLRGPIFSTYEKRMIPTSNTDYISYGKRMDALSFLNTDDYF